MQAFKNKETNRIFDENQELLAVFNSASFFSGFTNELLQDLLRFSEKIKYENGKEILSDLLADEEEFAVGVPQHVVTIACREARVQPDADLDTRVLTGFATIYANTVGVHQML